MDEDEMIYREMNEEDDFYMGDRKRKSEKKKDARKAMQEKGIGTKSQQVLKQQYEQNKQAIDRKLA